MTTAHIDGASRGNPGPAAYALTLVQPGHPPREEAQPIGQATNNVAEYTALVRVLEVASELGLKELAVFSDSELLVKQMAGVYRVKSPELQDLYQEACHLRKQFQQLTITHVRRAENKRADFLCNEALDGRPVAWNAVISQAEPQPQPTSTPTSKPRPKATAPLNAVRTPRASESLETEAVAFLNAVRTRWARGEEEPTAIAVWDQLWRIIQEPRAD
jgi:ribonuclease HI